MATAKAKQDGCRVSESSAGVDVSFVVRQKRGEDGAAGTRAGVASDPDAAAVPDDDIVCDPETKSVAVILFGGEEGVEDFGERCRCDAGAGVDEANGSAGSMSVVPGL